MRNQAEFNETDLEGVVRDAARLPDGSPLRRASEDLASGKPLESIQPLIAYLTDPSPKKRRERELAITLLGAATLDERESAIAASVLSSIVDQSPREALSVRTLRALGWISVVCLVLVPLVMVLEKYIRESGSPVYPDVIGVEDFQERTRLMNEYFQQWFRKVDLTRESLNFLLPLVFGSASLMTGIASLTADRLRLRKANRARSAAAIALGRLNRTESAASLLSGLQNRDPQLRDACASALARILPGMDAASKGSLTSRDLDNLARSLQRRELTLPALSALTHVGGAPSVPYVEAVVQKGETEKIRSEARLALEAIRRRQVSEDQASTLLRPSLSHGNSRQTLMRPAESAPETGTQLLRAAGDSQDPE
jgi:hypothetical protein